MAQSSRISNKSDQIIHEMVAITGKAKIEIIEEALEVYRYHERMRLFNESYLSLKENKKAWEEELKEREDLEGTLNDGFENE